MTEYAIRYGDRLVLDGSWACMADVIASYHGGGYTGPDCQVTGVLLSRAPGDEWQEVTS